LGGYRRGGDCAIIDLTFFSIKRLLLAIACLSVLLISAGYWIATKEDRPLRPVIVLVSSLQFRDNTFSIAQVKPENQDKIRFYFKDENQKKFGTISTLNTWLQQQNEKLLFATNGGIFQTNTDPLGLYIENSKQLFPLNTAEGTDNFYLRPNGVFMIQNDRAAIVETSQFKIDPSISFALQSGPLLLSNNTINAAFSPTSTNVYIRSGVGISPDGTTIFAISNEPVTFYNFASLFKDQFNCRDALYLDGAISEMYLPGQRETTRQLFSAIIGITEE
jgi:uncharacterized protein YigE (DUF2233 family)